MCVGRYMRFLRQTFFFVLFPHFTKSRLVSAMWPRSKDSCSTQPSDRLNSPLPSETASAPVGKGPARRAGVSSRHLFVYFFEKVAPFPRRASWARLKRVMLLARLGVRALSLSRVSPRERDLRALALHFRKVTPLFCVNLVAFSRRRSRAWPRRTRKPRRSWCWAPPSRAKSGVLWTRISPKSLGAFFPQISKDLSQSEFKRARARVVTLDFFFPTDTCTLSRAKVILEPLLRLKTWNSDAVCRTAGKTLLTQTFCSGMAQLRSHARPPFERLLSVFK